MYKFEDYRLEIKPLSKDDGNGFLVSFPDLPGCMADGETIEEALHEAKNAFKSWIEACRERGRDVPEPGAGRTSGKFLTRVPKTLYARLVARAKHEGISLDTLVSTTLAEHV